MTLSDKRIAMLNGHTNETNYKYREEDVKEAVKKLKKNLNTPFKGDNFIMYAVSEEVNKIIDKIFGEKLTKW